MGKRKSRLLRARKSEKATNWPRALFSLGFTGAVTLALTLMGYGDDMGYLARFERTPEQLQHVPLDFLLRSRSAFFDLMNLDAKLLPALAKKDFWEAAFTELAFPLPVVAIVATLVVALAQEGVRRRRFAMHSPNPQRPGRIRRLHLWLNADDRLVLRHTAGLIAAPVSVYVSVAIALAGLVTISWLILTAFLIPPILLTISPARAGEQRAISEVIRPQHCRRLPFAEGDKGAHCVRVTRLGCEVDRGRYVDQGGNRVLIYHKRSGVTSSVALDSSIVEDAASEEPTGDLPACVPPAVHAVAAGSSPASGSSVQPPPSTGAAP